MSQAPLAAVVVFPGSNGDRDLLETLTRAGFSARPIPSSEPLPDEVELVGLPGGFSYGDYWRAGMLASQAPAVQGIADLVQRGGLCIGICNGFQILVESGLLDGALATNAPPGFRHRWITIRSHRCRPSPWLDGLPEGQTLRMPMAHGEGNYFHPEPPHLEGRIPFVYEQNPNGSLYDAAALLDDTGRILGIMPHPERAADPDLGSADGLALFRAAYRYLIANPPTRPGAQGTLPRRS